MPNPPNTILLIRLSAIGDAIMASALLPAIKNKYPNSRILWLAEPAAASLLKNHPLIDQLIVLPRAEWKSLWRKKQYRQLYGSVKQFIRALKAQQVDWAIDAQGLLKSGVWAWFSGAKRRIGLGSKEGSQYLMSERVSREADNPQICSEYYDLACYLKLDVNHFAMSMPVDDITTQQANQLLVTNGLNLKQSYMVICPFTTRPQKHWIDSHWQRLVEHYLSSHIDAIVVLGGAADQARFTQIFANNTKQVNLINLVGKTSLPQATALIKQAKLLIGVDTGLTHMGIAQQTPTIAIFGSTFPYLNPQQVGDSAKSTAHIAYHKLECAPCRRNPTCGGLFTCMQKVTPELVWQQAQPWLIQSNKSDYYDATPN